MERAPVVVIGAGFGGLSAAVELACRGQSVVLVEREATPGGKARAVEVAGRAIDVGPTVLTMQWVFEEMFARAGRSFTRAVALDACDVVARHAFHDGKTLDLHADLDRGVAAVAALAGGREAEAYRRFDAYGAAIADIVKEPFLCSEKPSASSLALGTKRLGLGALARIDAHRTMARAIDGTFADARLRALFARYATYVGSSPYEAPATLNLVSHVERRGVSVPRGGMSSLAAAVAELAASLGVELRFATRVREVLVRSGRAAGVVVETDDGRGGRARDVIEASAVVANADVASIAAGALGDDVRTAVALPRRDKRSLSAVTWAIVGRARGFPLAHHNVFFSADYRAEHAALFGARPRLAEEATVYVCAQDRAAGGAALPDGDGDERLFVIVNAPATADTAPLTSHEVERCERSMLSLLARAGLEITPKAMALSTPALFERLAPGTGGALYGEAAHGPLSALSRPSARTKLRGFYVAGGSVHPGPGVPMAALSGRAAANAVLSELASTATSPRRVMLGSISTP